MRIPRMMVAAPGSGSGKTMLTCALLQAFADAGKQAVSFKCGPDFIDPMFHKKVLGISSKNLDPFFTGEELTKALFLEDANGKDIALIEGVMGLFDGLGGIREEASSYHLAGILKAPVVLVINARGAGRSLLPLIAGFLQYDTGGLIQGVILNRISQPFFEMIKPEIEENLNVRVLGYVPDLKEIGIESRHLGLMLPAEIADLQKKLRTLAETVKHTVDIGLLLRIAKEAGDMGWAGNLAGTVGWPGAMGEPLFKEDVAACKTSIGVAADEAFCFYYEDNLRLLKRLGAEIIPFSPLKDFTLPKGLCGLLLGGGYPELYAEELSGNDSMKKAIAKAISDGMPVIAECGGFLYLHEELQTAEGNTFLMAGAVRGSCRYLGKPVRFGYMELEEKNPVFLEKGERIKGHEFHYFDSTANGQDCVALKPVSGRRWECVHESQNCWWGFPHLYYYSNPAYARHFMERAVCYEKTHPCFN